MKCLWNQVARMMGVGLDPVSSAGLLLLFMELFLHPASLQDHSPVHPGEYQTDPLGNASATHLGRGSGNWICNMLQYCITVWAVTLFPELQMDPQPPSFTHIESCMVAVGPGE